MALVTLALSCQIASEPRQLTRIPNGLAMTVTPFPSVTHGPADKVIAVEPITEIPSVTVVPAPTGMVVPSRTVEPTPKTLRGQIVFTSARHDIDNDGDIDNLDGAQLYIFNLGLGEIRQLTTEGFYDASPAWSPDGAKIAFISNRDGNHDLYVIDADGNKLTRLTNTPETEWSPTWSPDGTQLAFQRARKLDSGLEEVHLFAFSLNDGSIEQLTNQPNNDFAPDWSPDGKYLAFAREGPIVEDGKTFDGNIVYLQNMASGEELRLTSGRYEPSNIAFSNPSWLPCSANEYLSLDQQPGIHDSVTITLFKLDWESSPPKLAKVVGINRGVGTYTWAHCDNWLITPVYNSFQTDLAVLQINVRFSVQQTTTNLAIQQAPILTMDDAALLMESEYLEDAPDWIP